MPGITAAETVPMRLLWHRLPESDRRRIISNGLWHLPPDVLMTSTRSDVEWFVSMHWEELPDVWRGALVSGLEELM